MRYTHTMSTTTKTLNPVDLVKDHFGGKPDAMLKVAFELCNQKQRMDVLVSSRWTGDGDHKVYVLSALGYEYRVFRNKFGCWDWSSNVDEIAWYSNGTSFA